ncbi:MAG: universal stress protein [Chitinophagaceae bacterium]
MSSLFKSILIPVDFSSNTEVAVNQAIELACTSGSTIHLLHVVRPKTLWSVIPVVNQSRSSLMENYHAKKVMSKLDELKCAIEESVSYCKVNTYVTEGTIYRNIQDAAKEIKPELIVIGKNSNHKYFSLSNSVCPNGLAKSTGYPVLTVMKNTDDTKIKIIVVPVGSFIPNRKIELVIELAKKYRAAIHLVTIPNEIDFKEAKGNSFLETYRILKNGLTSPIEHHILKGNNLPKAILEYAKCIGADLILVNPGSETKISNLTGKHINDVLPTSSKLKILSIEPYHGNQLSAG